MPPAQLNGIVDFSARCEKLRDARRSGRHCRWPCIRASDRCLRSRRVTKTTEHVDIFGGELRGGSIAWTAVIGAAGSECETSPPQGSWSWKI